MRLLIDLQGAQGENAKRGIGRYSLSLVEALVRGRPDDETVVLLNGAFPASAASLAHRLKAIAPALRVEVWEPIAGSSFIEGEPALWRRAANELIRRACIEALEPDVLLLTSLFEGLVDDVTCSIESDRPYRTAVVLYDLIPHLFPEMYLGDPRVKAWYGNRVDNLRRADLYLAISESSRQDAIRLLGIPSQDVWNISAAADACFSPAGADLAEAQGHGIVGKFILYTGGIDHRKNVERLITAYASLPHSLRAAHQLVIVCSIQEADRERLQTLARAAGLHADRLILTGYVAEVDLVALYRSCEVFVFPSWYEGFGLPALEAMACGAAVLGSDASSVPEVIGHPAALFDPHDVGSIERKIRQVLQDRGFKAELQAHAGPQSRKFSWQRTAATAMAAVDELVARRLAPGRSRGSRVGTAGRRHKPRLAFVSPVPPSRTGIANYSADLLPLLSQYYEIDVVSAEPAPTDPWIDANALVRTPAWAAEHAERYQRVLYHFGNSEFHRDFFGLLARLPGVVVLHDFYLSGIVHYMDSVGYRPGTWRQALYRSHGYPALQDEQQAVLDSDLVWKYPANLSVVLQSKGVIVHSRSSLSLADRWIGNGFAKDWRTIPLLRLAPSTVPKRMARQRLGIASDAFLVCSFGLLGPMKLNDRLVRAWRQAGVSKHRDCRLVFVGENDAGSAYGKALDDSLRGESLPGRISISGWATASVFQDYLAAADVAVQLRGLSRGETSAAVLDCLNHGIPTIVNANGSMADLPHDSVCMLPDQFTDLELAQALDRLHADEELRLGLASRGRSLIQTQHAPQACAALYHQAIEDAYRASGHLDRLIRDLSQLDAPPPTHDEILKAARAVDITFPASGQRQLLVDVSELVQRDVATGIQRVVRAVLKQLLAAQDGEFRVEPVYASVGQGYRYAREFTVRLLGLKPLSIDDEPIRFSRGDLFLGLDLQQHIVASHEAFYRLLRRHGVATGFVVYDLIPVLYPTFFNPGAHDIHGRWLEVVAESDFLLAISHSVAKELAEWISADKPDRAHRPAIEVFRLGADLRNSISSSGIPADGDRLISRLRSRPTFLMVGTVEPRKGQALIFETFERLWRQGHDLGLVIVGKQGWMVEALIERWSDHPERGLRFEWLSGISDEFLEQIYEAATCLIAGSVAEGYGLPLIEAARHGLPVFARDIPVFREVAGKGAFYFSGTSATRIAEELLQWLVLERKGMAPAPEHIRALTWEQSAAELMSGMLKAASGSTSDPSIASKRNTACSE